MRNNDVSHDRYFLVYTNGTGAGIFDVYLLDIKNQEYIFDFKDKGDAVYISPIKDWRHQYKREYFWRCRARMWLNDHNPDWRDSKEGNDKLKVLDWTKFKIVPIKSDAGEQYYDRQYCGGFFKVEIVRDYSGHLLSIQPVL